MSGLDRSLIFTYLLEHSPEFAEMEAKRGGRLISDAQDRLDADRIKSPGITTDQSMRGYLSDITANGTCDAGILERYVDSLVASDQAYARGLGVQNLPEGFTIKPA